MAGRDRQAARADALPQLRRARGARLLIGGLDDPAAAPAIAPDLPAATLEILPAAFYRRPAAPVAADLLGRYLVRQTTDGPLILRIVETEAYLGASDRASHGWRGRRTARNASLWLSGGHAYVYRIYGLHWCLNAVTGDEGEGGAVLLRAGEPVVGRAAMEHNRRLSATRGAPVAAGPGRLCQALQVERRHDGLLLDRGELVITAGEPAAPEAIARGPRIGIDYAGEAAAWPLRFAIADHPEVSRPRLKRPKSI